MKKSILLGFMVIMGAFTNIASAQTTPWKPVNAIEGGEVFRVISHKNNYFAIGENKFFSSASAKGPWVENPMFSKQDIAIGAFSLNNFLIVPTIKLNVDPDISRVKIMFSTDNGKSFSKLEVDSQIFVGNSSTQFAVTKDYFFVLTKNRETDSFEINRFDKNLVHQGKVLSIFDESFGSFNFDSTSLVFTIGNTLYKTTNGVDTVRLNNTGLENINNIGSVLVNGSDYAILDDFDAKVYTYNGIFWTETTLGLESLSSKDDLLKIDNRLFLGGFNGNDVEELYLSKDFGKTFEKSAANGLSFRSLYTTACLGKNDTILASSYNGLYYTVNEGEDWTISSKGRFNHYYSTLCSTQDAIYGLNGDDGIFSAILVSKDNGATFSQVVVEDYNKILIGLVATSKNAYTIENSFVDDSYTLKKLTDDINTWTSVGPKRTNIDNISFLGATENYLYLLLSKQSGYDLIRYNEALSTFKILDNGINFQELTGNNIKIVGSDNDIIITNGLKYYEYKNQGESVEELQLSNSAFFGGNLTYQEQIFILNTNNDTVMYRSLNDTTWKKTKGTVNEDRKITLKNIYSKNNVFYAVGNQEISVSTDAMATWDLFMEGIEFERVNSDVLITSKDIYVSTNADFYKNTPIASGTPLAVEAKQSALAFELFPNPAQEIITIYISKNGTSAATLYDINGKQTATFILTENNNTINISEKPAGYYTLKVQNATSVGSQKLILVR